MRKGINIEIIVLALLLALGIVLAGCSGGKRPGGRDLYGPAEGATITVVDCAGRKVEIPADAERIGCLYAFSGHVVSMLGKAENIVAVVEGMKRDKLLTSMYPAIERAMVPSSGGIINIEELIRAGPDLIFVKGETARNEGEVEKLRKAGIPYLVVDYKNIEEQQYAVEMIGKAVDALDKAKSYNKYYQSCIDRVQKEVSSIPEQDRVRVYHSVNEATRTDAKDTLPADWTQVAGAINVSVNKELKLLEGKYFASLEQILLWDPEVIICNEDGVPDYIMSNRQWSALKAVKNHKVYQMPNGISRWGHPGSLETPLAILWTAKTLYPDRFSDLDLVAEIKYFYREFFDYQISDEVALKVLDGRGMRTPKSEQG